MFAFLVAEFGIFERIILNFIVIFGSQCFWFFFFRKCQTLRLFLGLIISCNNSNDNNSDDFIFSLRGIMMKQHEKQLLFTVNEYNRLRIPSGGGQTSWLFYDAWSRILVRGFVTTGASSKGGILSNIFLLNFQFLMAELNLFYLKFILWIPPPHFIMKARLALFLGIGAVGLNETFRYMDDP